MLARRLARIGGLKVDVQDVAGQWAPHGALPPSGTLCLQENIPLHYKFN
jgi:hypothetical protein